MSKNKKDSAQKFDDIFGGELDQENTDFDTSGFGDFNFDTSDEVFEFQENTEDTSAENLQEFEDEEYEQGEYLPVASEESGSTNILHKAVNIAQENKVATAGVGLAAAFGLWKLFGPKKQEPQESVQQGSPNTYDDELLGLDDEEDSIDAFLDEQTQINPMFTPLRFK